MLDRFPSKAMWVVICLFAIFSAIAAPKVVLAQADGSPKTVDRAKLTKDIDALLESSFPSDQPGAAVIVLSGGQKIYESVRGMAELELNVSLSADMVFRLGSITKQFTAAAIMLLVEEGEIALTDEITKFLPDYPTQGAKITVEHLLTHTSGVRSYTGMPGWMETKIINPMTVEELIDGFKNEPMDFQPGEEFRYNNSGYILLGAIIEKASGKTYAQFIQQRIFDPLEMTSSYYGDHATIIENRVSGYDGSIDDPKNSKYISMTQPYAAGSLLSTVGDLGKWNTALFAGKVVNQQSLALMISDYKLSDGSLAGYGYGLLPGDIRGHKTVSHGGGIFGFVTHGVYLPDDDVYVAVLCNSTARNPASVGTKIAAMAVGDPFPEFKAVKVSEESLERYVGVYKIDEKTRRYLTLKDGQLHTLRTGSQRLAAVPSSETAFFYETNPSHFEFVFDDEGNVSGMKMFADGNKQAELAMKIDEAMPSDRAVADVDFNIYEAYVGDYQLSPEFSITIIRDGDHLFAQATGQGKNEIFPASETVFFLKVVEAEIAFVRDDQNEVTVLILKQGGAEMKGKRK